MDRKFIMLLVVIITVGYFWTLPALIVSSMYDAQHLARVYDRHLVCGYWYGYHGIDDANFGGLLFGHGVSCGFDEQGSDLFNWPLPPGMFEVTVWMLGD